MITSEIQKKEDSLFKSFAEMEKVISALANVDAIKIFYAAAEGIKSSTEAIKEMDLTQKRYYTHLRNLTEAGLIEKGEEAYQHTMLGKICYKLGEAFKNALSQRDRLDLADRLGKAKNISIEETEEIMRAILKQANIGSDGRLTDFLGPVRVADSWEKVVHDTMEYIEKTKEIAYLATQYFDARTIEAVVRAAQRGVRLNCLIGSKETVTLSMQMLRVTLGTPNLVKFFFDFVRSPQIRVRYVDLPYTFFVFDGKYAMVEIVQPYTKAFSLAFFFHNEKLAGRLIENFEALYRRGSDLSILKENKEKVTSFLTKRN